MPPTGNSPLHQILEDLDQDRGQRIVFGIIMEQCHAESG